MRSEEEIKAEIKSHWNFIKSIDYEHDSFAGIMEADSQAWIKALEWVLDREKKETDDETNR